MVCIPLHAAFEVCRWATRTRWAAAPNTSGQFVKATLATSGMAVSPTHHASTDTGSNLGGRADGPSSFAYLPHRDGSTVTVLCLTDEPVGSVPYR